MSQRQDSASQARMTHQRRKIIRKVWDQVDLVLAMSHQLFKENE